MGGGQDINAASVQQRRPNQNRLWLGHPCMCMRVHPLVPYGPTRVLVGPSGQRERTPEPAHVYMPRHRHRHRHAQHQSRTRHIATHTRGLTAHCASCPVIGSVILGASSKPCRHLPYDTNSTTSAHSLAGPTIPSMHQPGPGCACVGPCIPRPGCLEPNLQLSGSEGVKLRHTTLTPPHPSQQPANCQPPTANRSTSTTL